jgi:hypothetical protein
MDLVRHHIACGDRVVLAVRDTWLWSNSWVIGLILLAGMAVVGYLTVFRLI